MQFYCSLLWHSFDVPADDYHRTDRNAGVYWHSWCTGCRYGYADHGIDLRWFAGEGVALVAGVDRIFDMGRTTVNITGDASCTIIVSNLEKKKEARKNNNK